MTSRQTLFIMMLLLLFGVGSNPRGEKFENDVKVCENATAILHCSTTDGSKSNHQWRFASKKLIPLKTDKYEQIQNGAILLVKNVKSSDVAQMKYISCQTHSKDWRRIVYLYQIMINCRNIVSSVGSSVRLPCKADIQDDEIEYIKWTFIFKRDSKFERLTLVKKDGKITLASSLRFDGRVFVQNKTLIIHNIQMGDVGTYQCIAYRKKNIHLSNPKYHYNVNVTSKTTRSVTVDSRASVHKIITPSPNTAFEVLQNTLASNETLKAKFTTASTTQSSRKMVTSRIEVLIKPANTYSLIHLTHTSVPISKQKSNTTTIQSTWPTKASLPNIRERVLTTKTKDILPITVDNKTLNDTKRTIVTSNGSTNQLLSCWPLVYFFCPHYLLMLSLLDKIFT